MPKKLIQQVFKLALCLCLFVHISAQAKTTNQLSQREDVQTFIQMMVEKHHFKRADLNRLFNKVTLQPAILQSIAKPAEQLTWARYHPIFLTPKRIQEGVTFWQENKAALAKAQKEYGVAPEVIVAILGVETFYGKQTGSYRVLDALVTLGFDYPPRAKFFRSELEQFLLLARDEHWDPMNIKGSYAGAMGKAQFIASSYRNYAVDFNQNGQRDLINSTEDAIGSVANYFKMNGWQTGKPVAVPAKITGEHYKSALAPAMNPKPESTLNELAKLGIHPHQKKSLSQQDKQSLKYAVIELQNKDGAEYWLGAPNFYVITRYNRSNLYAMAVYQLSQEIKSAYQHA